MNPQQHEVHDLPSNTSTTVGSPHGNLLMSGLCLSLYVSFYHTHTHTEVKNLTLRSHTIISSPFSPSEGLWLQHRWASDLSWECNEHQPRPPHPVSGSRPKWHVVWFSTCYTTQERHLAKQWSSPCLLMRPRGQKKKKRKEGWGSTTCCGPCCAFLDLRLAYVTSTKKGFMSSGPLMPAGLHT